MNKLNLLAPRIKSYYTRGGKGQEIRYLDIDRKLSLKALENDVLHGAKEFSELLKYVGTNKSRKFTIINAESEEEGLMAVTYLSAIYNKADESKDVANGKDSQFVKQEAENSYSNEREEMKFDDDQEECFFDQDEAIANGETGEDDCDGDEWEESKWRLPIIPYERLNDFENEFTGMNHESFFMAGVNNVNKEAPFWLATRKEPVCIVRDVAYRDTFHFCSHTVGMAATIRRFQSNSHVYLVLVSQRQREDDDYDSYDIKEMEREACEVILEYLAGTVAIKAGQDELDEYRENLFENYIAHAKRKLAKGFPKSSVTKRIVSINNPDKSSLINKVIKYVISQYPEEKVLKKEHFDVLASFKLLGVDDGNKEGQKSADALKNEIVGLEKVKQQIYRIVNIMKYNKKREEMGLGKGEYHNVHLLIGAPGTAKTTVAQLLGQIMAEEKLLPGNRFRSVNGAELKGMYVGHSAPKVHALFEENDVILIDEAYSIVTEGEDDSFAREAIAQLIIEMEKHGTDKLVMFAGYGGKHVSDKNNKMKTFIDANPGIRSRINSTIYFDSYSVEQMMDIFHAMAKRWKYEIEKGADEVLYNFFAERISDANFGNGREVRSILENIVAYAAERIMKLPSDKLSKKEMSLLKKEDVKNAVADTLDSYKMQKGREKKVCGFIID